MQCEHTVPHPRARHTSVRNGSNEALSTRRPIQCVAGHCFRLQSRAQDSQNSCRQARHSTLRSERPRVPLHSVPLRRQVQHVLVGPSWRAHSSHPAPCCCPLEQLAVCGRLLCLFLHADFPEAVCLLLAFLACVNAPISWKKAQTATQEAVGNQRTPPLYRDLRSASGTLNKLIHPQFWQPLLDSLDESAKAIAHPPGLWLPRRTHALQTGPSEGHARAERRMDSRIADPLRTDVHLGSESKAAVRWHLSWILQDASRFTLQTPHGQNS